MECSICEVPLFVLRNPIFGYNICETCSRGAKNLITLINNLDGANAAVSSLKSSSKDFETVIRWVKEMKEREEALNEKVGFLGGFESAFKERMHTDILVKSGSGGPRIPAHRALLASKSEIFKNMLDSDGCKSAPSEAITIPELNYMQLDALLEFLYSGTMAKFKLERHCYALFVAADKYEIPFLQKFCELHMLTSLSSSNALDILEISDVCSNVTSSLKETSLNLIVKNMEEIVFSTKFETFVLKNPHLSLQITRVFLEDIENKRSNAN